VRNKDQKNSDEEEPRKEVAPLNNEALKDKFKIDEQTSKKTEPKVKESPNSNQKSFMQSLGPPQETKSTPAGLGNFAPPPLTVDIENDKAAMPPPPATGISPRGAFTPTSALQGSGLRSPAMTRPNYKCIPLMSPYRVNQAINTARAQES